MNRRLYCFVVSVTTLVGVGLVPAQRGMAADGRTIPVVLPLPAFGDHSAVIAAWNAGLGKPFDIVADAPLADNFDALARVKIGSPAWTVPSFAQARRDAGRAPKTIRWLMYDFERWQHTPGEEQADVEATARAIRQFCDARGWKAATGPMYRDGLSLARKVAPCMDGYMVQCQKFQRDAARPQTVKYLREIAGVVHQLNPKCLVGCQLGSLDAYGDGSPGGGVKAALALYNETKDFLQIYGVWWPPDGQRLIELLRAMDAPSAPTSQATKPKPSPP